MTNRTPAGFTRGDSVEWTEVWRDYPAPTWTLTVAFVAPTDHQLITATDDGHSGHLVRIEPAESAGFEPGVYRVQIKVADGTDVRTLEHRNMVVQQNFDTQTDGYDDRTFAQRALEAIEAVIVDKASSDQLSFSVAGKQLSRFTWSELLEARDYFAWQRQYELDAERATEGLRSRRQISTRFLRP